jgi:hypothetical protein
MSVGNLAIALATSDTEIGLALYHQHMDLARIGTMFQNSPKISEQLHWATVVKRQYFGLSTTKFRRKLSFLHQIPTTLASTRENRIL